MGDIMNKTTKIGVVTLLAVAVVAVMVLKNNGTSGVTVAAAVAKPVPKLLDLGAGKCIPCKKMAPILEGLKKEYKGRMDVEFIDVWKDSTAAEKYKIEIIPTQIFYDAEGKELFRHIGFYSKDDILAKWKELGVDLK
jgi:thioredoxin 1